MQFLIPREKTARQNVFHFAGAIGKTVGLSYKDGVRYVEW